MNAGHVRLVVFIVLMFLLFTPSALAQVQEITQSMRDVGNLFWGVVEGVLTPDILKTQQGVIVFLRFSFMLLVATLVYIGVSRIQTIGHRQAVVISVVIASFILLVPRQTMIDMGTTYITALIITLTLGLVSAAIFLAWHTPPTFPGILLRIIILGVALGFMLFLRTVIINFIRYFGSGLGGVL